MKHVRRQKATTASSPAYSSKHIRAWAKSQGLKVGERGRIHPDIIAKYHARDKDDITSPVLPDKMEDGSPRPSTATGRSSNKRSSCGFCMDRTADGIKHEYCPGTIIQGAKVSPRIWSCLCWENNPSLELHPRALDKSSKV